MWRKTLAGGLMCSLLWAAPALAKTKAIRKTHNRAPHVSPLVASTEVDEESITSTAAASRREPEILNKAEMLSLVKKYSGDIADSVLDAERQREQAIHDKDPIKLSCIQDRLSNMKAMKKLANDRFAATQRPRIQEDELNLRHEFRGVELAHTRVIELHKELMECVGESLEVSVSGGPSPNDRGAVGTTEPAGTNVEIPKVDRPPAASLYQ